MLNELFKRKGDSPIDSGLPYLYLSGLSYLQQEPPEPCEEAQQEVEAQAEGLQPIRTLHVPQALHARQNIAWSLEGLLQLNPISQKP